MFHESTLEAVGLALAAPIKKTVIQDSSLWKYLNGSTGLFVESPKKFGLDYSMALFFIVFSTIDTIFIGDCPAARKCNFCGWCAIIMNILNSFSVMLKLREP
jgi:hypothetical protein